jgi:hypothetical protein|eukprot:SAG25_NODE_123_length_14620_cov_73.222161_5_plen_360_part_00
MNFVCIDPRRLGEALRGLKLTPALSDADIRSAVARREQSSRARSAVDLLEFTKLVAASLASGTQIAPARSAPTQQPFAHPRISKPATMAPWLKKRGDDLEQQAQNTTSQVDQADFPMLGAVPPPAPAVSTVPDATAATTKGGSLLASSAQPRANEGPMVAPPSGTLARQLVAAALDKRNRSQPPATAPTAPRSRGWEMPASSAPTRKSNSAGPSLREAYPVVARTKQQGAKLGRGARDPGKGNKQTLDEFFGSASGTTMWLTKSKSNEKQSKRKKKSSGVSLSTTQKGKIIRNSNQPSGAQTKRKGIERETPKKKRVSKLKRIILEERERKYLDLLVHRWVYAELAARIMVRRYERNRE